MYTEKDTTPEKEITQPTKQQIKDWCAALRSGQYEQGKGYLQQAEEYCCLGVACKIFIPKKKLKVDEFSKTITGILPDDQRHAPQWLIDISNINFNKDRNKNLKKIDNRFSIYLSTLNDNEGLTFDEIADVLELIYIHKALDTNEK